MKSLRHVIPGLVLTIGVAGAAYADDPTTEAPAPAAPSSGQRWHGHHRTGGLRHTLAQLNLTADQQAQIRAIFVQSKPRFRQLSADRRARRASLVVTAPTDHPAYDTLLAAAKTNASERMQLASDVRGLIYNVLTPTQQAQIPAIVAAQTAERAARRAAWQSQRGQS